MKLQTVWTKAVVVIYLVAIVGACLYVPSYYSSNRGKFDYRGVWVLNQAERGQEDHGHFSTTTGIWIPDIRYTTDIYPLSIDYGRVALEVVSLTVIAGVLFLIGSFVGGQKTEARSRGGIKC
jgi:hypothetical protein